MGMVNSMWRSRGYGLAVASALSVVLAGAAANALASGTTGSSGPTGSSGSTGSSSPTSAPAKPKLIKCSAGAASGGTDQWLWSAYGKPSSSSSTVSYSQTSGGGSWTGGHAKGTICSQDQGGGEPKRSIALLVSGSSRLTANTKQLGLLGVAIVLHVTVSKSGDPAVCPVGATGTVSLFASYYGVHRDKASLAFSGTCAAWDQTFTASILHVEISHDGAEIR
jgi:hypothetical protein